jgi:hypothetical protein
MHRWMKLLSWVCGFVLGLWCVQVRAAPAGQPAKLPGVALSSYDASIGEPVTVGNLAVFPIYAKDNPRFANAIGLAHALESGKAKVREIGEGDEAQAEVGTLVIENLGNKPIVVLAGTVVKGGKQDRQIAQDFVLAAKDTVDVEAFCVEQGRWSGKRDGKNTGGKFSASGMLAPITVRTAGQYKGDQGEVWDQVAKTNARSKKKAESGTLMATYDDAQLIAKRRALAKKVDAKLPSSSAVLGIAYAIDGNVRGVRWFGSRSLFEEHRRQLLETAAVEAILAPSAKPKPATAKHVRNFIEGVAKTAIKESKKRPKALNTNHVRENPKAYSSEAQLGDEPAPVTVDISAK